jgi:hypothetical protein
MPFSICICNNQKIRFRSPSIFITQKDAMSLQENVYYFYLGIENKRLKLNRIISTDKQRFKIIVTWRELVSTYLQSIFNEFIY